MDCLGILTGAQLFSLNKDELKSVCGDEGSRIYSQITVQKEQLEVSGASSRLRGPSGPHSACKLLVPLLQKDSGSTELQEILWRRQQNIKSGAKD